MKTLEERIAVFDDAIRHELEYSCRDPMARLARLVYFERQKSSMKLLKENLDRAFGEVK